MTVTSARFTDPEHTMGVMSVDGTDWHGPLPPNAGDLRAIYEKFVEDGGMAEGYVAPPPPPPGTVTQAQAKIALSRAGLLAQVKAVIAAYPEEVQIWFDSAGVWERGNTYVAGIALELDMSDDTVDELFANAAKIA